MTHEVKSWPAPFSARWDGYKGFEYRKDDRDYQPGDYLHEREWDATKVKVFPGGGFTGRSILSRITYKAPGPLFGIPKGYCVLSVTTIGKGEAT